MVFKKGYKMTEEHKRKIGLANAIKMKEYRKKHRLTEKQLDVITNSSRIRKEKYSYVNSPETRKKLSNIMKYKWKNGEYLYSL